MPTTAFRNLVDTQYEVPNMTDQGKRLKGTHLVAKAYLTYEEVIKQIQNNLCQEEVDTLLAYIYSFKFPTRQEQLVRAEKQKQKEEAKRFKYAREHPLPTKAEIAKANGIERMPVSRKPILWNDPSLMGES